MTREEIEEIIKNTKSNWSGDNAFKGLSIISKYTDNILQAAEHEIIYSEDVDKLIEKGITKEDVLELARLNWHIDYDGFACFV